MLMTELKSQFTKDLDEKKNKLNALQVENDKYSNELKTKKEELIFNNHNLTLILCRLIFSQSYSIPIRA
jgi:hypothetical protein